MKYIDQYTEFGKTCSRCGNWKTWDSFGIKSKARTGYDSGCLECMRIVDKNRYANDPEKYRNKVKIYISNNYTKVKKRQKLYSKEYYKKNKELITERTAEYKKQYYIKNKEKLNNKKKCYRAIDSVKKATKLYNSRYREENKEILAFKNSLRTNSYVAYSSYVDKLTILEDPWCGIVGELLVRCATCREYFAPLRYNVQHRINSLNGKEAGENRLYCSDNCRDRCSVYKINYKSLLNLDTQNKRLPFYEVRDLAFGEYGKNCERCGKFCSGNEVDVHHELSVKEYPEYECDLDNLWVLCKECHKEVHKQKGCTYSDIAGLYC
jgi:hypothetical protein